MVTLPPALLGLALGIHCCHDEIAAVELYLPADPLPPITATAAERRLGNETARQLGCWLDDPGFRFELPLASAPTPFADRVRKALQSIPVGQTRSYGELAHELGSAPRAVAQGCRRNPLPILVACHRVVAGNGLGGYAGSIAGTLVAFKAALLQHERQG